MCFTVWGTKGLESQTPVYLVHHPRPVGEETEGWREILLNVNSTNWGDTTETLPLLKLYFCVSVSFSHIQLICPSTENARTYPDPLVGLSLHSSARLLGVQSPQTLEDQPSARIWRQNTQDRSLSKGLLTTSLILSKSAHAFSHYGPSLWNSPLHEPRFKQYKNLYFAISWV